MAVARRKAQQAARPQPRAEPLDQFCQFSLILFPAVKARLAGGQRVGRGQKQADAIVAKAGVERVGKAGDPLVEQAQD